MGTRTSSQPSLKEEESLPFITSQLAACQQLMLSSAGGCPQPAAPGEMVALRQGTRPGMPTPSWHRWATFLSKGPTQPRRLGLSPGSSLGISALGHGRAVGEPRWRLSCQPVGIGLLGDLAQGLGTCLLSGFCLVRGFTFPRRRSLSPGQPRGCRRGAEGPHLWFSVAFGSITCRSFLPALSLSSPCVGSSSCAIPQLQSPFPRAALPFAQELLQPHSEGGCSFTEGRVCPS